MTGLLFALVPTWFKDVLACALALVGVSLIAWLKGKSAAAQVAAQKKNEIENLAENHAVEQKEAAAETDPEADDALDAAARADSH